MGFWTDSFASTGPEISSQTELPGWYQSYLQQLTGKAAAIADQPYQAYPGQRIAGFTDPQQQAFQLAQQNVGAWQPQMQQAGQLATQSSTYDPGALSQFMNPYTKNVVDEMARLGTQNFQENLLPAANAAFTGSGQFGSTRNQEAVNRAARDVQANITGQQAGALQSGFNVANQNYQNWAQMGQKGSQLMADLAARGQGLGLADVGALSQVGGAQQQLGQQNLDWAYQQFLQQQQQPQQNLGMLNAIIRGLQLPGQTSQSMQGYTPSMSGAQSVAGGLSSLGSLFQ